MKRGQWVWKVWLLVVLMAAALGIFGGCRKEVKATAPAVTVTPKSVAVEPAKTAQVSQELTKTVVCWDGSKAEIPVWAKFVGNRGTEKFHRLTCEYIPSKANQVYFKTREEAIAAGQVPCKRCQP